MSLEQIQAELALLPHEQQNQLAAFLVHLRHQREPGIRQEISRRLDDKDSSHWVNLDELEVQLK
jgi:hypothetical protein